MYKNLEDSILLSLIANKNPDAFHELYKRYWDRVFAVCLNRVGDQTLAEDLVQDIFLSIWLHKDLEKVLNIEAYLFQAVKFSVIKNFHKASRESTLDPSQIGLLDGMLDMSMEDVIHSKILQELIFQEVERLPERTKLIFIYSRLENLSSLEIAERLDISPRTVENQISNALRFLRNFLRNIHSFMFF